MNTEINNTTKHDISEERIKELVEFFSDKYDLPKKDLSIAIINDPDMTALNKQYRQKEGPTDILSFDGEDEMFGELVLDFDQIKRQEAVYSSDTEEELLFMITHGLLHLIGYQDDKEEDRLEMIRIGKDLLETFLKK